jgi:hypothetical protein
MLRGLQSISLSCIIPHHSAKDVIMPNRSIAISAIAVPLVIGLVGLATLMHEPRFATFRNVDIVRLLGVGMCFGVALFGIVSLLRGRRIF